MNFFRTLFYVTVLLILAGCIGNRPGLNEGSVRGAFVPGGAIQKIDGTLFASTEKRSDGANAAGANALADAIKPSSAFQISLISAYICDFHEAGGGFNRFAGSNSGAGNICENGSGSAQSRGFATRGEIVISARFDDLSLASSQELDGDRVVFFSNDVRETGQMLNFANQPIYGPAKAPNGASKLTMKILELDKEEAEHNAALLEGLADLGAALPSPAVGAAFGTLVKLGSDLVKSNQDDVEFSFSIGFDAAGINATNVAANPLRSGYIAFVRKDDRNTFTHFDDLKICPEQGFISQKTSNEKTDCKKPYSGDTWMLIRIAEMPASTANALAIGSALATLRQSQLIDDVSGGQELIQALNKAASDLRESDTSTAVTGAQ